MFASPTSDSFFSPVENPRTLPPGLIEERVRVDRKLYEKLLSSDGFGDSYAFTGGLLADEFFQSIMTATGTEITWPSRLRLNTRSRKDPHIKIVGTPERVDAAKAWIYTKLDTRVHRVTLKMDVAFTDHSHVIGKGGRSIQKVMDGTGCHIHFPDSNRTNALEKSNQVSIAGSPQGTEQARCRLRELLPVSVHYEIPLDVLVPSALDPASSTLQTLQRNFGLNITFKSISPFRGALDFGHSAAVQVTVRGSRALTMSLRQGIAVLLDHLTSGVYEFAKTPALIETEIAAQHHAFVMGRGNCNIRSIVHLTGAVVTFPEAPLPFFSMAAPSASSVPNKKSNVKIKGANFDSAYHGWLELMGYLPLLLIFDLPEGKECDASQITQLMDQLKVSILIKPKQKQSNKSIMVRGAERDSRTLFEVRRQILDLDQSEVPYCCEPHYWAVTTSAPSGDNPAMHAASSSLAMPSLVTPSAFETRHQPLGNEEFSSYLDSRSRAAAETSLTTVFNQQHGMSSRKNLGRLDVSESASFSTEDCRSLCRSLIKSCSVTSLDESFRADDVFASSLPPDDKKGLQSFKNVNSQVYDGSSSSHRDLSHEFGNWGLSKTVPEEFWRKDVFAGSGLNRHRPLGSIASLDDYFNPRFAETSPQLSQLLTSNALKTPARNLSECDAFARRRKGFLATPGAERHSHV